MSLPKRQLSIHSALIAREGSHQQSGPTALWRAWSDDVEGHALPAGHFFPEEAPQETTKALSRFFSTPESRVAMS